MSNYEWKKCLTCPIYEINQYGTIRKIKSGKVISERWNSRKEVLEITLNDAMGVKRTYVVKELVAEAFLGLHSDEFEVVVIDGDECDVSVNNLQYVRKEEYFEDERVPGKEYIMIVETGELFETIYDCSERTGSSVHSIQQCLKYPYLMNHDHYHFKIVRR